MVRWFSLHTKNCVKSTISSVCHMHHPNVMACARNLANGNATAEQQLITYAKSCVEAGYQFFKSKCDGELKPVVSFFKGARMLSLK